MARIESSVTSVSWIPLGAMQGLPKMVADLQDGQLATEVGPGAILGEMAVLEHDVMTVGVTVGVVPARVRDRERLLATLAASRGRKPPAV
jgi:CRP-like cAMP-binding protein